MKYQSIGRQFFMYIRITCLMIGMGLFAGCSASHYKRDADKDAYEIIRNKQMAALGLDRSFSIESRHMDSLERLPKRVPEPLGDPDEAGQQPVAMLSMADALDIASRNSREYQSKKEDLFIGALDLSLARYKYGPILSGNLSAAYKKTEGDETVSGDGKFGVSKLFADGTKFTADLSTDLLMHLVRSPREAASSIITATLTKPLWKGAGARIAQENLLQAERDMVYRIRDFAQYHRGFAVDIASSYYRVLQSRDSVTNSWNNYRNLVQARERTEMMAEAGRVPEFEVDQAEQNVLRAKDSYVRSEQSYQQSIDHFKVKLGLPADSAVGFDPHELDVLRELGIQHPDMTAEEAVDMALAGRLDLRNAYDQVADAVRKVAVAENGLAPGVDLVLSSSVPTAEGKMAGFRTREGTYSAGIDMDLPLDRRSERNTYRVALINEERSKRSASLFEDQVKLNVRDAWRKLEEAKASYDIQQESLALAQKRVESTTMLQQAGRASTREVLEAQDARLEAQNAVTRALVDHVIARLEFWRDIGILDVDENGIWLEPETMNDER